MGKCREEFEKWLSGVDKENSALGFHRLSEYRSHMCKIAFSAGFEARQSEIDELKAQVEELKAIQQHKGKE